MALIAIEEHWNLPALTSAVKALPEECGDASVLFDEIGDNPARLRAFSTLPMADPKAAVAELERAAGLGFVAAMVYGRTGETPLEDARYDDLFAAAAALRQPIFIHRKSPRARFVWPPTAASTR